MMRELDNKNKKSEKTKYFYKKADNGTYSCREGYFQSMIGRFIEISAHLVTVFRWYELPIRSVF